MHTRTERHEHDDRDRSNKGHANDRRRVARVVDAVIAAHAAAGVGRQEDAERGHEKCGHEHRDRKPERLERPHGVERVGVGAPRDVNRDERGRENRTDGHRENDRVRNFGEGRRVEGHDDFDEVELRRDDVA
jgi:hypothetical protein